MSIALWYCPPQGSVAYEIISQLISSLQTMFPSSPLFEPHITIATNLLCIDKDARNQVLTSCVAAIQSINKELIKNRKRDPLVSFNSCSIGKKFFKKVTLDCNENKYLMSIAKIIQEMYSDPEVVSKMDTFHPHVSLLYSDVKPMSKAYSRMIQQRVQDTLDIQLDEAEETGDEDTQMRWNISSKNVISWNIPGTFKIVNCEGSIEQWKVLGSVDV